MNLEDTIDSAVRMLSSNLMSGVSEENLLEAKHLLDKIRNRKEPKTRNGYIDQIKDAQRFLIIYKTVLIPALMRSEINKLESIKALSRII